jgi:hypothetical protein
VASFMAKEHVKIAVEPGTWSVLTPAAPCKPLYNRNNRLIVQEYIEILRARSYLLCIFTYFTNKIETLYALKRGIESKSPFFKLIFEIRVIKNTTDNVRSRFFRNLRTKEQIYEKNIGLMSMANLVLFL